MASAYRKQRGLARPLPRLFQSQVLFVSGEVEFESRAKLQPVS